MAAAVNNHVRIIETLVVFLSDAEIGARDARTALMFSVQYAKIDTVRLLLSLNADTTKTNQYGQTAFQRASTAEITIIVGS